jgi:transposase
MEDATTVPQPPKTRRHYSRDLRERIIHQYRVLDKKPFEIAENLDVSLRVVQRTIQLWKEIGDVVRNPDDYQKRGRTPLMNFITCNVRSFSSSRMMTHAFLQYILGLLEEKPDMYLDEIALDISETLGVSVSLSTIHRSLQLLGLTRKKVRLLVLGRRSPYLE